MAELPVSPCECALAIAVPLTRDALLADLEREHKDFASHVFRQLGTNPELVWRSYERLMVQPARRTMDYVAALGANVRTDVSLDDLASLCRRFRVITLVAHALLPSVAPHEILNPTACAQLIVAGGGIVARTVSRRLPGLARVSEDTALRNAISNALNACLRLTTQRYAAVEPGDAALRDLHEPTVSRVQIEQEFAGLIAAAPFIELSEGLQPFPALISSIPLDYSGVMDFSVCNSVSFGETLKRRRPKCMVVENVHPASPDVRLPRYGLIVKLLASRPRRFTDAVVEVHKLLARSGQ